MCGIFGAVHGNGQKISDYELDSYLKGLSAIQHRGPDALSYHLVDQEAFLGHTRLSILDLDPRSNQPFVDPSQNYFLTYNGEVYNYLELQKELESKGYVFQTTSDTEVVLYAFLEWGENCLQKFNGMWAFAIWDRREKRLFLARDRFGIKPLYLLHEDSKILFSSEMKAFLEMPSLSLNYRYIYNNLLYGDCVESQSETLFKKVQRILPGHFCWIQQGRIDQCTWWKIENHLPDLSPHLDALKEQLEWLIADACKLRMRSDVPLGIALSGGLDSSAVTCTLASLKSSTSLSMQAFIASYPSTEQEELFYAQSVAHTTQIPYEVVSLSFQSWIDSLDAVIYAVEDGMNLPTGPYLLYREYQKRGFKISVEGHGADELFGGYIECPSLAASKFCFQYSYSDWLRSMHVMYKMGRGTSFLMQKLTRWLLRQTFQKKTVSPLASLPLSYELPYVIGEIPSFWQKTSVPQRRMYSDFHFGTLPSILKRFDHCAMASGVEIRSPFMDWRIVAFAHSLPLRFKWHKGYNKYLIREAMRNKLPRTIMKRCKKLGFTNPHSWFREKPLQKHVMDLIHSDSFLQDPWFPGKQLTLQIEKALKIQDFSLLQTLWPLIQMQRLTQIMKPKTRSLVL